MRKNILKAILKKRVKLNLDSGQKNVFHLSLQIDPKTLSFQTGSCICVFPKNPAYLLDKLFGLLKVDPNTTVTHPKTNETLTAYSFFENHVNFYQTRLSLIKQIHEQALDAQTIKNLAKLDLISYLIKKKDQIPPLELLVEHTAPLLPRYYSISSSQKKSPNTLDLMISTTNLEHDHIQVGIASGYLTNQINIGDEIHFSYHENKKFTLPECQKTPIIMIGPGTGLAPFRGFLHDLEDRDNSAWLFTGAPKKDLHFYYKNELLEYKEKKALMLSHAFSQDQETKVYVQHLMQEQSALIYEWLEEKKGIVYICGDAKKMAKDVQVTLKEILIKHKKISEKEAKNYLKSMRQEGRLNLDVY